jgi:hypothetical protein
MLAKVGKWQKRGSCLLLTCLAETPCHLDYFRFDRILDLRASTAPFDGHVVGSFRRTKEDGTMLDQIANAKESYKRSTDLSIIAYMHYDESQQAPFKTSIDIPMLWNIVQGIFALSTLIK